MPITSQAKTRPSAGFSDVYLRVVTNRREAVKNELRRVDCQVRFSSNMAVCLSKETYYKAKETYYKAKET